MARGRNGKDSCYVYNSYFLDGIRLSLVQDLKENENLPFNEILNKYNLNKALTWRWEKIKHKGNQIDINKVNIAKQCDGAEWVEVPQIVIKIISDMINQKLNNNQIVNEIKIRLKKEGFVMENNKLVVNENKEVKEIKLNLVADIGNNLIKTCANDSEVITFVNKVSSVVDVNLVAGDYLKNVSSQEYYVMADEFAEFNITQNKYDKKNIVENVYYCIGKCIDKLEIYQEDTSYSVSLALLIPLNQMKDKDKYKAIIEEQCIYDYECRINDKVMNLQVSIDNIEIMPEGAIAYTQILDDKGDIIIADTGSQTCNLSLISNGRFVKKHTIDHYGSFRYYRELINKISNNEITINNIQRYIANETPIDDDLNVITHDTELLMAYYKDLLREIKNAFGTKVNKIYYIGGTVLLFEENGIIPKEKSIVNFVENPAIANVLGAMMQLKAMYPLEV